MRESLARAVNSSDLEMEEYVTDVDRVAAMSAGSHLGSYLLRVRDGGQVEFAHRAMLILAKRVIKRHHIARTMAEAIAAQALIEWVRPHCRACGGARELMIDSKPTPCPTCGGSGVHRHSDSERRAIIGAWGGRVEIGFNYAAAEITAAAADMATGAKVRLG